MGTAGFQPALDRGEPLAEISVRFRAGVDGVAATQWINSLANDFDLWPRPWYDNPQARIGTATKAALDRLFGWKIVRVPLPGSAQNLFWWDDVTQPTRFP